MLDSLFIWLVTARNYFYTALKTKTTLLIHSQLNSFIDVQLVKKQCLTIFKAMYVQANV